MKIKKLFTVGACIAASASLGLSFTGCHFEFDMNTPLMSIDELAETFAISLLGNSAYNWNVFSVDPKGSFDVELDGDAEWYRYIRTTDNDVKQTRSAFHAFRSELKKYNPARLSAHDATTYRSLESALNSYIDYYDSSYARDFELIGAPYISSHGGYVAEFASMFENYALRNEGDVEDLLDMTKSTRSAFSTYILYAGDRAGRGYPLYDYTVCAMQDYLDDVTEQGDEYYLYSVADSKLDGASFLSSSERAAYKTRYAQAIGDSFMTGVSELSAGLEQYKGNVTTTEESYLAAYGNVGKEYYQWQFENKTGIRDANILSIYYEMVPTCLGKAQRMEEIEEIVNAAETTDPALYSEFNAYKKGERALLGLTDPNDVLAYLKEAAKEIVPDLKTTPDIDFKYMDRTAGEISNLLAYYLLSPVDDRNAAEHITLNPYTLEQGGEQLLPTVAHEGYPGHLYAHVNAKDSGANMLTLIETCTAFSEGWAKYTEMAVMRQIAENTNDRALKLYCEYFECSEVAGFLNMVLSDIQINYLGYGVSDLISSGVPAESAQYMVENLMEEPAVYVPYGYGLYVMLDIHDNAKTSLGNKYNEVEFNGYLLSEGAGPTIPRAKALAAEFVGKKR